MIMTNARKLLLLLRVRAFSAYDSQVNDSGLALRVSAQV